jgi:glycogen operon protein
MIAEPWDIGPGGYQLGKFPADWLEWNDRFRDDVRRFWRGDGRLADVVTRLAGSTDIFPSECRSVNFLAAHDGFTLADTVAYARKHNHANGEDNRDGHGENYSWNCGAEGPSDDPDLVARRDADLRALLGTLFASTGTIMLTAGDEFGRSQHGNNNAYAQDNAVGWVDWERRDRKLEGHVAMLAAQRVTRNTCNRRFPQGGNWTRCDGQPMTTSDWEKPATQAVAYMVDVGSKTLMLEIDRPRRSIGWRTILDGAPCSR